MCSASLDPCLHPCLTLWLSQAGLLLAEARCSGDLQLLAAAIALRDVRWDAADRLLRKALAQADVATRLQAWWLQCQSLFLSGELAKCADRIAAGLVDVKGTGSGVGAEGSEGRVGEWRREGVECALVECSLS